MAPYRENAFELKSQKSSPGVRSFGEMDKSFLNRPEIQKLKEDAMNMAMGFAGTRAGAAKRVGKQMARSFSNKLWIPPAFGSPTTATPPPVPKLQLGTAKVGRELVKAIGENLRTHYNMATEGYGPLASHLNRTLGWDNTVEGAKLQEAIKDFLPQGISADEAREFIFHAIGRSRNLARKVAAGVETPKANIANWMSDNVISKLNKAKEAALANQPAAVPQEAVAIRPPSFPKPPTASLGMAETAKRLSSPAKLTMPTNIFGYGEVTQKLNTPEFLGKAAANLNNLDEMVNLVKEGAGWLSHGEAANLARQLISKWGGRY